MLLFNKIDSGFSFIEIISKLKDSSFKVQLILIWLLKVLLILSEQIEFFSSFVLFINKLKVLLSKLFISSLNELLIIPKGLLIRFVLIKFPAFKVNVFLFLYP